MSEHVYIVVTQTQTMLARAIKSFTKKPYNHSSISGDMNLDSMYSICRNQRPFPLPANINQENINTVIFGLYANIPCEIYELNITKEQRKKYDALINHFIKNRKKYAFNLPSLITVPLNKTCRLSNRFTCSQFVAYTITASGIHKFDKHISLILPDDFRFIPNAKLIYHGNLKDWKAPVVTPLDCTEISPVATDDQRMPLDCTRGIAP